MAPGFKQLQTAAQLRMLAGNTLGRRLHFHKCALQAALIHYTKLVQKITPAAMHRPPPSPALHFFSVKMVK